MLIESKPCFSLFFQTDRYDLAGRDGKWLQRAWETYLRPKYRDALRKWFSQTGGGSGNVWDFQDYCGNERWIAWVFMLDSENGYILCSNASPVCPDALCNETGFYRGKKPTVESGSAQKKRMALTSAIDRAEKSSEAIIQTAKVLTDFITLKKTAVSTTSSLSTSPPKKKQRMTILEAMDEVKRLSEHSASIADYGFSPNTKEKLLSGIRLEQRLKVTRALHHRNEVNSNDSE